MEIGPLAEWFTAIAEILAVMVALFLPYYERKQAEKKDSHRIKVMLLGYIDQLLESGQTTSLKVFLRIVMVTDAAQRDPEMLEIGQQVLNAVSDERLDETEKREKIKGYRQELQQIDK